MKNKIIQTIKLVFVFFFINDEFKSWRGMILINPARQGLTEFTYFKKVFFLENEVDFCILNVEKDNANLAPLS